MTQPDSCFNRTILAAGLSIDSGRIGHGAA